MKNGLAINPKAEAYLDHGIRAVCLRADGAFDRAAEEFRRAARKCPLKPNKVMYEAQAVRCERKTRRT